MSVHVAHPPVAAPRLPAPVVHAGTVVRLWALVVLEAVVTGLLVVLGVVTDA